MYSPSSDNFLLGDEEDYVLPVFPSSPDHQPPYSPAYHPVSPFVQDEEAQQVAAPPMQEEKEEEEEEEEEEEVDFQGFEFVYRDREARKKNPGKKTGADARAKNKPFKMVKSKSSTKDVELFRVLNSSLIAATKRENSCTPGVDFFSATCRDLVAATTGTLARLSLPQRTMYNLERFECHLRVVEVVANLVAEGSPRGNDVAAKVVKRLIRWTCAKAEHGDPVFTFTPFKSTGIRPLNRPFKMQQAISLTQLVPMIARNNLRFCCAAVFLFVSEMSADQQRDARRRLWWTFAPILNDTAFTGPATEKWKHVVGMGFAELVFGIVYGCNQPLSTATMFLADIQLKTRLPTDVTALILEATADSVSAPQKLRKRLMDDNTSTQTAKFLFERMDLLLEVLQTETAKAIPQLLTSSQLGLSSYFMTRLFEGAPPTADVNFSLFNSVCPIKFPKPADFDRYIGGSQQRVDNFACIIKSGLTRLPADLGTLQPSERGIRILNRVLAITTVKRITSLPERLVNIVLGQLCDDIDSLDIVVEQSVPMLDQRILTPIESNGRQVHVFITVDVCILTRLAVKFQDPPPNVVDVVKRLVKKFDTDLAINTILFERQSAVFPVAQHTKRWLDQLNGVIPSASAHAGAGAGAGTGVKKRKSTFVMPPTL